MLDTIAVQKIIGVRFPFLMIDQILELEPGVRAVSKKNYSVNEWFFQGHLPGHPLVPGVLLLESMAQTTLVTLFSLPANKGKGGAFAGADKLQFRKPVFPGDTLTVEVKLLNVKGAFHTFSAVATVQGAVVASADVNMAVTDKGVPISPAQA